MENIIFEPTIKQAVAYYYLTDKETTEIGFGGGSGGAKSWLGCFWVISSAFSYPGTRWLIGRKDLINLKRTTLETFFKVLKYYKIEIGKDIFFNQTLNTFKFPNGSSIICMGLDYEPSDPLYTRFGGLELTGAFVDESNEIKIGGINILNSRIGRGLNDKYKLTPKLLETFNPSKNHVYVRYYKPSIKKELPRHRVFIRALATDNPYISKEYINQLKNSDKITKERLLYGNFEYDSDPSNLIDYDCSVNLFTNSFVQKEKRKYITADIALMGSDRFVIMVWEGFVITKIKWYEKIHPDEVQIEIEKTAKEEKVANSDIIIDSDGVGNYLTGYIKGCKGFVNNAKAIQPQEAEYNPDKKENYGNLKSQCYFELAKMINQNGIYIQDAEDNVREWILEELEVIKRDNVDSDGPLRIIPKEKMKEILGRSPDFADCMAFRMYFELNKRNIDRKGICYAA